MEIELKMVPTIKLRPDPNQPRKTFDKEKIQELAMTYKNQGIINPIECDEKFMIITGERRWRAARLAGLKEVPVKIIIGLSKEDRLERQIIENYHLEELNDWEKKNAWWKLYEMLYPEEAKAFIGRNRTDKFVPSRATDFKLTEFARKIGTTHQTIMRAFETLEFTKRSPIIKKMIEKDEIKPYVVEETKGLEDKERIRLIKTLKDSDDKTIDKIRKIKRVIQEASEPVKQAIFEKKITASEADSMKTLDIKKAKIAIENIQTVKKHIQQIPKLVKQDKIKIDERVEQRMNAQQFVDKLKRESAELSNKISVFDTVLEEINKTGAEKYFTPISKKSLTRFLTDLEKNMEGAIKRIVKFKKILR